MNKTNYKQYDTRWAKLGYPKSPYFIKDCGCGEVAICNFIIEMDKYKNQTPKTIQPYCKQFAEPHGNGTYFSGIPKMMEHYGMTEVKEHQTMDSLWKELKKGNRVAIYLMGSRPGGSKKVHWTSGGHFVCSVAYKVKNGKHMVYVKDSYSTSSDRNGWISYEENMRGDVSRVWSGKLNGKLYEKPKTNSEMMAEKANEFAYATNTSKAKYPDGEPKPEYEKGLNEAYPDRSGWGTAPKEGASCDVFVGTVVRCAGVDKNFPRGLSPSYIAKSKKFKQVSKSNLKDGDIIVSPKHICIHYGGKIKEASHGDFYPKTTNTLKARLNASGAKVYRAK